MRRPGVIAYRKEHRFLRALLPALLALALPAGAEGGKDGVPSSPVVTLSVALRRDYDTNVLRLPQNDIDRQAERPGPPRFLIRSVDDNINTLRADLHWRTRPLRRRETELGGRLVAHTYQRNDVMDWQQFTLSLTQELTASRRHLAILGLFVDRIPNYYLGEITDADDSFAAGHRIRRSLSYAQTTLGANLGQNVSRGRVELSAGFERQYRDYDSHFSERDNRDDRWSMALAARPFPRWRGSVGLAYGAGRLEARGNLASTEIRDVDISYDHHAWGVSLDLPWGRGPTRGHLSAGWRPETRTFTTADIYDVTRFGRVNRREETSVQASQHVWGPLEVVGSYYRLTSEATFPAGVHFAPEVTDFTEERYGLMVRGQWDVISRRSEK